LGVLQAAEVYPAGNFPLAIDLGDIDGDGDLDMVASNFGTANFTLYENDGTGLFINPRTLNASSAASCAVLHDRDNDGDLDMTGIDEIDDLLILFTNPGGGTTQPPVSADKFELRQNYPNPFNGQTTIAFSVRHTSYVTLKVYNSTGQLVQTLLDRTLDQNVYEVQWDGKSQYGKTVASGIYIYKLQAGTFSDARKLLFLK